MKDYLLISNTKENKISNFYLDLVSSHIQKSTNEQVDFREYALTDPSVALPDIKVRMKLREEDVETLQLSQKKILETYQAIKKVGEYWFRPYLYGLPNKR